LSFVVDAGNTFWPSNMFEPLYVGVLFPYTHHRPWCLKLKRCPLMVEMGRELCQVCKEGDFTAGPILRKLFKLPRRLARVSASVASGVLHMPGDGSIPTGGPAG
jgi:hypothetical protein